MGESCQPREWSHHTMADAVDQMREIVTAQLENGFRVVTVSRDHPIREWLDSEQVRDDVETPREGARKAGQLTLF